MPANLVFAVVCWGCALVIGVMAVWAFRRKDPMHFWSGSTVRPEEISDIPAYNRANGVMWTVYAACIALAGVVSLLSVTIGGILLAAAAVLGLGVLILVYKRIYNKYKVAGAHIPQAPAFQAKAAKAAVAATVAITVIVACVIGVMIYNGTKDPVVSVRSGEVEIDAMYGVTIEYSEIAGVSLIEMSMSDIGIGTRTNGYGGIGQALKGNFSSPANGETLLFVQANASPTIKIERAYKRDVYISLKNAADTQRLYRDLIAAVGG